MQQPNEKSYPPPEYPPQGGYNGPPPPAYSQAPPQPGYPPQAGYPQQPGYPQPQPGVIMAGPPTQTVIITGSGNCPNCQSGILVDEFTCCGIALAILFFPWGLICCLLMKEKRCTSCNATF